MEQCSRNTLSRFRGVTITTASGDAGAPEEPMKCVTVGKTVNAVFLRIGLPVSELLY